MPTFSLRDIENDEKSQFLSSDKAAPGKHSGSAETDDNPMELPVIDNSAVPVVARTGSQIIRRQSARFDGLASESFRRSSGSVLQDSLRRISGSVQVTHGAAFVLSSFLFLLLRFVTIFCACRFRLLIRVMAAPLRYTSLLRHSVAHLTSHINSLCSCLPNARPQSQIAWLRFEIEAHESLHAALCLVVKLTLLHRRMRQFKAGV